MATCQLCQRPSPDISKALGVCRNCIRQRPDEALKITARAHHFSRAKYGLPQEPPSDPRGVLCNQCVNECQIPENGLGYCGLRSNHKGRLTGVSARRGNLSWYRDRLPTNCVADWVCPGGTGAGYPTYAYCSGSEVGYTNLAVFFQACSFNCLFCQNWHFKNQTFASHHPTVDELIRDVDERTACICYFGGDPSPQLSFSLSASRLARKKKHGRILRICWETNGSMNPKFLDTMMDLAVGSGGCVKFDLKAWDPHLHIALTGVTNQRTLKNFAQAAASIRFRPDPPLLLASTLLVPGYIDEREVHAIARFIADLNPDIPYSLLAFYPNFYMADLPLTPKRQAEHCEQIARDAGLKNVRIGNVHLLI